MYLLNHIYAILTQNSKFFKYLVIISPVPTEPRDWQTIQKGWVLKDYGDPQITWNIAWNLKGTRERKRFLTMASGRGNCQDLEVLCLLWECQSAEKVLKEELGLPKVPRDKRSKLSVPYIETRSSLENPLLKRVPQGPQYGLTLGPTVTKIPV